jgi:hypothetical protein
MNTRELDRVAAPQALEARSALRPPLPVAPAAEPLQALLRQAQQLWPDWRNPARFHERKSSLIADIKSMLDSVAPANARQVAPVLPASSCIATVSRRTAAPTPWPPTQSLTLALSAQRYDHLIALITAPTRRRRTGFQTRFRNWLLAVDEADRAITLSGIDVAWIRKQCINRKRGGWQASIHKIFGDAHPAFANLPARPRSRRSQQRKWRRKET